MPPDSKFAGDSGREAPKKAPKTGVADDSRGASPAEPQADARQQRLAQALRDNLKKRKAQQRQRQGGGA